MKITITLLMVFIFLQIQAQHAKRFEFKSIVVTYTIDSKAMGGITKGTQTHKIDDYGSKEIKEEISVFTMTAFGKTTTENKHTLDIVDGDMGYSIDMLEKEGVKTDISEITKTFQPLGMSMESDLQKYKGEAGMKLFVQENNGTWHGLETLLGKTCWVFTMLETKIWMYKGIVLKSESNMMGSDQKIFATSVQENVNIPASAFAVPEGITLNEAPGIFGNIENDSEGDSEKLSVSITYEQFLTAMGHLEIPGLSVLMNDNPESAYTSMFMVNNLAGMCTVLNENAYQLISSNRDEFILQKKYQINNHQAALGKNKNVAEDDVEVNVLLILFPEKKFTLMLNADLAIPVSTLEEIVRQFKP